MRSISTIHALLGIVLIITVSPCFSAETNAHGGETSKYLDAVRTFADNVLKYGRDTYGPKHTPLFVDGLNIHTHEPVKWIAPNGDRWILSNLASQQNLFRVLDGLTTITGDPKYKQAAMEAIEYAFANLQAPNGLFYWGGGISYDAQTDKQCGIGIHSLKSNYPYYELMWEVNSGATRKFIEAYWSTHILDWSNLKMDRGVPVNKPAGEAWNHEYKGGPVFFQNSGNTFLSAGSDLFCAAGFLGKASGDDKPLVWAKQLIHRYVETRSPGVGISGAIYTCYKRDKAQAQLGEDFKEHRVLAGTLFPSHPEIGNSAQLERYPAFVFVAPGIRHNPAIAPWASAMLLGDMLDADGKEFTQRALEELTAWGKVAYRKKDNSFIPMLTDGTSLEGYVCKRSGIYGRKGTVFISVQAIPMDFWTYALAYRLTGDLFMWDMARNIVHGHGLGDIGLTTESSPQLKTATDCWSPYTLLGFIELYKRTDNQEFLQIARRIGDNLLAHRLHKDFFVPSDKHIYTKFDTMEHLALLHLHAALRRTFSSVPEYWPSNSLFNAPYRDRKYASNHTVIYTLTESPYPAKSAEELIASGDVEGMRLFISQGGDVNASSEDSLNTPLYWAVIKGHKDIVELLLAVKDIQVDTEDFSGSTALHYAVEGGHKDIVELLLKRGADVNVRDEKGRNVLFSYLKDDYLDMAKFLIEKGVDFKTSDKSGLTPLGFAIIRGAQDIVELLLNSGVDPRQKMSIKGRGTSMSYIQLAEMAGKQDIVELLLRYSAERDKSQEGDSQEDRVQVDFP